MRRKGSVSATSRRRWRVVTDGGECAALTYHANPDRTDASVRPRDWYKDHVVRGAREHGLPSDYIRALETVET